MNIWILFSFFVIVASAITLLVRLHFWKKMSSGAKNIYISVEIICWGFLISLLFVLSKNLLDSLLFAERKISVVERDMELVKLVELFDIRRNFALIFFAIVTAGLAIWGRIHTGGQLKATEKQLDITERQLIVNEKQINLASEQLELTYRSNNNEIFTKAIEMMKDEKDIVSTVGGLQIISKLMRDEPESEYIRCMELVASWLQASFTISLGVNMPYVIGRQIREIMQCKFKGMDKVIADYMKQNNYNYWPVLFRINFNYVDLVNANLKRALIEKCNFKKGSLKGAKLSNSFFQKLDLSEANLTNADMSEAKGLKPEQILSAKWYNYDEKGKPPKLPEYLLDDEEIKKWLSEPHKNHPSDDD